MDAIDRFVAKNGRPPEHLEALVPDYIGSLPTSGFPRCEDFTYYVWEDKGTYTWRLSVFCEFLWPVLLDADEIACSSRTRSWDYCHN